MRRTIINKSVIRPHLITQTQVVPRLTVQNVVQPKITEQNIVKESFQQNYQTEAPITQKASQRHPPHRALPLIHPLLCCLLTADVMGV